MDADGDDADAETEYTRLPTVADLIHIARLLNEEQCRYVVLGGMAVNHHGIVRATADIDLMVEDSVDNMTRVIRALGQLPDHAALELMPEEIQEYIVLRINDEITIDLLARACNVTWHDASSHQWIETVVQDGVPIHYMTPEGLVATKQTWRPKDQEDVEALRQLHNLSGGRPQIQSRIHQSPPLQEGVPTGYAGGGTTRFSEDESKLGTLTDPSAKGA